MSWFKYLTSWVCDRLSLSTLGNAAPLLAPALLAVFVFPQWAVTGRLWAGLNAGMPLAVVTRG